MFKKELFNWRELVVVDMSVQVSYGIKLNQEEGRRKKMCVYVYRKKCYQDVVVM